MSTIRTGFDTTPNKDMFKRGKKGRKRLKRIVRKGKK